MKKATGPICSAITRVRGESAQSRARISKPVPSHADLEHHGRHMVRAGVAKKVFQFIKCT
jgi:hypothetical protein